MRNTSSPLKVIWVTQNKGNPSKVGEVGDVSGRVSPPEFGDSTFPKVEVWKGFR